MKDSYVIFDIGTAAHPDAKCKIDHADLDLVSGYKWGIAYMGGEEQD